MDSFKGQHHVLDKCHKSCVLLVQQPLCKAALFDFSDTFSMPLSPVCMYEKSV